jgi:hypothetical protein
MRVKHRGENMRFNQRQGSFAAGAYTLGLLLILFSAVRNLLAGTATAAPEIDAGSISAGFGLLAGGLLILRARRRSK